MQQHLYLLLISAAPRGPKLSMSPSKAKVGDTVQIIVQDFQLGPSAVSSYTMEVYKLYCI